LGEYATQRDRVIPRPTATPEASLRTSEDAFRFGYNYGYYAGHSEASFCLASSRNVMFSLRF
jgi:hypothetical protein